MTNKNEIICLDARNYGKQQGYESVIKTSPFYLTEPEVIELDDDDIDGVTSRPANNNKPTNTFVVVQGPHGPFLVTI